MLNSAYKELGDDCLGYFLKLCKLAKKENINVECVVKHLQLVDGDNPFGLSQLEKCRRWLVDKIHELDTQIERSKNYLCRLNDEIASPKALLNSYYISCEHK